MVSNASAVELARNFDEAEGRAEPASAAASYAASNHEAANTLQPVPDRGSGGECPLPWCAEQNPRLGLQAFTGLESFRGVSDAAGQGNFGLVSGFNTGVSLLDELGLGAQFGMSGGVYDWAGRTTNGADEANRAQTQMMMTYGFYRRACGDRFQGAIVQDWMVNDNFGTLSQEPTLSQWRAQVSFIVNGTNEFGVWGAWRDRGATQNFFTPLLPVSYRAIGQTNIFWHNKLRPGGMDSWIWWGVPAYGRLNQGAGAGGSIGEFTIGGMLNAPVTARTSAYLNLQYMKPSSRGGVAGSSEDFFDLGFGLTFIPGGSRSRSVAGQAAMPMMPVANNGNFLVDRSL